MFQRCPLPSCPWSSKDGDFEEHMRSNMIRHFECLLRQNADLEQRLERETTALRLEMQELNTRHQQQMAKVMRTMSVLMELPLIREEMAHIQGDEDEEIAAREEEQEAVLTRWRDLQLKCGQSPADWTWDSTQMDPRMILAGKSLSSNTMDRQSALGSVGWSVGVHRWQVRIDRKEKGAIVLGVHPTMPRAGGQDYATCFGVHSLSTVFRGRVDLTQTSGPITFDSQGDVVFLELNCDTHILTIASSSSPGKLLTITDLPPCMMYPYVYFFGVQAVCLL